MERKELIQNKWFDKIWKSFIYGIFYKNTSENRFSFYLDVKQLSLKIENQLITSWFILNDEQFDNFILLLNESNEKIFNEWEFILENDLTEKTKTLIKYIEHLLDISRTRNSINDREEDLIDFWWLELIEEDSYDTWIFEYIRDKNVIKIFIHYLISNFSINHEYEKELKNEAFNYLKEWNDVFDIFWKINYKVLNHWIFDFEKWNLNSYSLYKNLDWKITNEWVKFEWVKHKFIDHPYVYNDQVMKLTLNWEELWYLCLSSKNDHERLPTFYENYLYWTIEVLEWIKRIEKEYEYVRTWIKIE